jgi:hypothetical protein
MCPDALRRAGAPLVKMSRTDPSAGPHKVVTSTRVLAFSRGFERVGQLQGREDALGASVGDGGGRSREEER